MKYFIFILTIIACFCMGSGLSAQTDTTKKNVPAAPATPQNPTPTPAAEPVPFYRHAVKLEPILLINGDLPLSYEFFLTRKLSAEAGLGLTFKDYIRSGLDFDFNNLLASDYPKGEGSEFVSARLGVSFRAGVRFYPSAKPEKPMGPYFQAQFQAKSYNWTSSYAVTTAPNVSTRPEIDESRGFIDFNLLFGKQRVYKSGIVLDMFAGIGVRSRSLTRGEVTKFKDMAGNDLSRLDERSKTDLIPNLLLGLKVGFAF